MTIHRSPQMHSRQSRFAEPVLFFLLRKGFLIFWPLFYFAQRMLDDMKKEDISEEAAKRALAAIEKADSCPICLENFDDERITPCGHVFCAACIEGVIDHQHGRAPCPLCRENITKASLTSAADLRGKEDEPSVDGAAAMDASAFVSSSKIDAIIEEAQAARATDPKAKIVIFSQFTTFLALIQQGFEATKAGETLMLTGNMTQKARISVLEQFRAANGPPVLLASLRAAGQVRKVPITSHPVSHHTHE